MRHGEEEQSEKQCRSGLTGIKNTEGSVALRGEIISILDMLSLM